MLTNHNTDAMRAGLSEVDNKMVHAPVTSAELPLLGDASEVSPKTEAFLKRLTALACLSSLLFGYDTGIISSALLLIKTPEVFGLNDEQQELVVSSTVMAAIAGALCGGELNALLGRRMVIIVSSIVFVVGSLIMGFAPSYAVLLIGRVVVGLAVGVSSMTAPVYVSEAAPPARRGVLLMFISLCLTGGQLVSSMVAGGLSYAPGGWRYMLGLGGVPAFIQLVGFMFMPESPRWLAMQGRWEEAHQVLLQIRTRAEARAELEAIQSAISADTRSMGLRQALRMPSVRRALALGCVLMFGQQLGGINTAMYYGGTIIQMAGFTNVHTDIWLLNLFGASNFFGTGLGLLLVDRSGRRRLTLTSLGAVILMLSVVGLCFYIAEDQSTRVEGVGACADYTTCFDCVQAAGCGICHYTDPASNSTINQCVEGDADGLYANSTCPSAEFFNHAECTQDSKVPGYAIVVAVMVYLVAFAPGMGAMAWTVTAEIFPLEYRTACTGVTTAMNWGGNLAMSETFLTLINAVTNYGAFWLYAGISVLTWLYLYFHLPETNGLTLEQVVAHFEKPSDAVKLSALSSSNTGGGGLEEGGGMGGGGAQGETRWSRHDLLMGGYDSLKDDRTERSGDEHY